MTEEVIKEVSTSTPASAEPKSQDHLINSPVIIDGNRAPSDLKRKEKPVPHYLRASTSSCHDNCKYGIRHSSESKKNWPVHRAQLRRASTGSQDRDRIEIVLPQKARPSKKDQKLKICHVRDGNANATTPAKPEFTNPKAPLERVPDHSDSIPGVEDLSAEASEPFVAGNLPTDAECFVISHDDVADSGDGESSNGAVSIELEMPLAIQDSDASDEHIEDVILPFEDVCEDGEKSPVNHVSDQSANDLASSEKRITQNVMMASEKREQARLGTKSKSSANESVKPKAKTTSSLTRNTVSSQKISRISHPKAAGAASEITGGLTTMRKKADPSGTKFTREKECSPTVTSAVPKVKEIKVPSPSNATESSAKHARLARLKTSTAKTVPSPSLSSRKMTDRKVAVKNVVKNAHVLQKKGEEKVTTVTGPLKLSRSVNMSAKSIPGVKLRSVRKEKIAHPIKSSRKVSRTENSGTVAKDAKEKVLKTASPKVRKPEVNNKETRPRKEKLATPRTQPVRRPKPAPVISSSNATPPPPRKLTFRRGKVVNPDENSSTTPRRLCFRPAMAGADATGRSRAGRVSTGRRIGSGGAGARDAGTSSRAEVVVLRRRQDGGGEGKERQEQGLFNNVIEETASRLVTEARKSKVKALVGAFETVISLQERTKPAAAPAAAAATAGAAAP